MEWLRFEDLTRHYGAQDVFAGLSGVLRDANKVALVGANGAGKSSLLRVLAGIEQPDAGNVARSRDARFAYLAQDASGSDDQTLSELIAGAFARLAQEEAEVRELEVALAASSEAGDTAEEERLMRAYGVARERFDRHGGERSTGQTRAMLAAFGFNDDDLHRPTSEFSGGQRTRAMLARTLLEEPDVLLLDEPTNHLDVETVRWLEDFLRDDPRPCIVVSHDRYFLERIATEVWDLERGTLSTYETRPGSAYGEYLEQKHVREEEARREYEAALTEEKRARAVIAELRTHGSHNYAQVRSREKLLARQLTEKPSPPSQGPRRIGVRLEAARRATSGFALETRKLGKSYERVLFSNLSLRLQRGERLAVIGENGSGKSTLLKIIAGLVAPDSGSVQVMTGVKLAYFSQESESELPAGRSAVDAILEAAPLQPEQARNLLGRMGLGGDAADKPVEAFSGGERRRIMLARLMARSADCLLLDEPTNDLDIRSREALEDVLAEYEGAMMVVSHDRYLLRRIAERVLWLHAGNATLLEGGYEAYEALRRAEREPQTLAPKPAPKPDPAVAAALEEKARRKALVRELAACEAEVARLDARENELQHAFAHPALYDDPERVAALGAELREVKAAAQAAMLRWEQLTAQQEALEIASP